MMLNEVLQQNSAVDALFRQCEYEALEQCQMKNLKSGTILAHKYEPIAWCYFMISGECSAYNEFENGRHYMISHFGRGIMVGEMEAIAGVEHYLHAVYIEKNGTAIAIPREVHARWMKRYPAFSRSAAERLANMLCTQSWTGGETKILRANELVGRFLMRLYRAEDKAALIVSDTRERLSDKLGISVRTLNRVVASFDQKGWIQLRKGKITLDAVQYKRLAKEWNEQTNE